jgi:hypothetical protein
MAYYTRWVCRLDLPWPDQLMRAFYNLNEEIYGVVRPLRPIVAARAARLHRLEGASGKHLPGTIAGCRAQLARLRR